MRVNGLVLLWCSTFCVPVFGQQVTVQQPVVGLTSVNTAVAVPDRGRTFLGGVSAAQSSRTRFGFGQPGSSLGLSRSLNSMSVGVTIIDLREMDEALLNSVPNRPVPSVSFARHAAAIRPSSAETPREATPTEEESPTNRAAKFERLALKAEDEHRPRVAKLHWQMAAKYGSTTARERLLAASR